MSNLAMTAREISIAKEAEDIVKKMPQADITIYHTLHSGVYTRTLLLKKGTTLVGALIKIPTTLIVQGDMKLYIGKKVHHLTGYNVIPAMANRKQVMFAHDDTRVTMLFRTDATTIKEAEDEFTDDELGKAKHESIITEV